MPPVRPTTASATNLDALQNQPSIFDVATNESMPASQNLAVTNNREALVAAQNDVQTQYLKQAVQSRTKTTRQTQVLVTPRRKTPYSKRSGRERSASHVYNGRITRI